MPLTTVPTFRIPPMTAPFRQLAANGEQDPTERDTLKLSLGAIGFVLAVGYAIHVKNGYYAPEALLWLTIGLALLLLSFLLPDVRPSQRTSSRVLAWVLAAAIVVETLVGLWRATKGVGLLPVFATVVVAVLGLVQLRDWVRLKPLFVALAVAAFAYTGFYVISLPDPAIDVFDWQQQTSLALTGARNPYLVRIAPRYGKQLYPRGTIDENGYAIYALPYPPLSLLMVLPGFVLGNDVRYADLFALVVSAVLMAFARPGRVAALAALLFLLTPRTLYVLWNAWTEPLMVLTFSLVMFCACRWRSGLPWALGLFLATKQTTIWAVPLVVLLVEGPNLWKQLLLIALKAGAVVAVINAPFLLWNVREFVHAVVLLRVVPSFVPYALTYLAWMFRLTGKVPPTWLGAVLAVAAVVLVLRKAARTPAAFAAGVTLVTALFFAFSQQAFCNYYYFTIGTACWAIAAARMPRRDEKEAASCELRPRACSRNASRDFSKAG